MLLDGNLSERFLDLILCCIFFHIENSVEFRVVNFLLLLWLSTATALSSHEVLYTNFKYFAGPSGVSPFTYRSQGPRMGIHRHHRY